MKALASNALDISDPGDNDRGWINNKEFNMLIAAYDMYFRKFPHHKSANMRIGSTGSRYRDCAGLMSFGYLMNLLGMENLTDIMDWRQKHYYNNLQNVYYKVLDLFSNR